MTDNDNDKWLRVSEAAGVLGVSERTVWRRVKRGELDIDRSVTPHLVNVSDALTDTSQEEADAEAVSYAALQTEVKRLEEALSETRDNLEDARRERDRWSSALDRYMMQTEHLLGAGDVVDGGREEPVGLLQRVGRWLAGER